jgi:hypothetical protein
VTLGSTSTRNRASYTPLALMIVPMNEVSLMRTTVPTSGSHEEAFVSRDIVSDSTVVEEAGALHRMW